MTTLFVSAYKDIGRENWPSCYKRPRSKYTDMFCKMATAFHEAGHKLIAFVDQDVQEECQAKLSFAQEFLPISSVTTFLDKYEAIEQAIIDSAEYKASVPSSRKLNPEHVFGAYNLINHSKVNMLVAAKKLYPDYEYYMWTDFGCTDFPTKELKINEVCQPDKVVYAVKTRLPPKPISARQMLTTETIYVMGSEFVAHRNVVDNYEQCYERTLLALQRQGISDDDQNVVYQMTYMFPHLFQLVFVGDWFSMFRRVLNKTA